MDRAATVEVRYDVGFVVLSYLVSVVGCVTSLELLHRRTSRHGAINWYLLVTSSMSMGGIGIWCMHFIGNRALQLDNGNGQIGYSSGFTVLSLFLPIVVLLAAFYLLGGSSTAGGFFLAISAFMTGTAVCGMHYLGQLGIINYSCTYRVANVIGAGLIAVVATSVTLCIFFRLRETWTNNWWKRSICGFILAGAVSGMHWTATVGTSYQVKGTGQPPSTLLSRTQTVIVCTILSLATCILLLAITFLANLREQQSRKRACQLVLASAYFDETGRVMVTPQGLLPSQMIANSYVEKTFGDGELTNTHPAFLWTFRASHNWTALENFLPGIKQHLERDPVASRYCPGSGSSKEHSLALVEDFGAIFKELFCVAADGLASQLSQPLHRLGVLFQEPLSTGIISRTNATRISTSSKKPTDIVSQEDLENGVAKFVFGKGQFLFLVQHLDKRESDKLAAHGYRFAAVSQIAGLVSKSMLVPHEEVSTYLDRMKDYTVKKTLIEPGIHIAAFVLRPKVVEGFDILVPIKAKNQLPTVALPFQTLTTWQREMLENFNERSILHVLQELRIKDGLTEAEQTFQEQFHGAVIKLVDLIGHPSFLTEARFSARMVKALCHSTRAAALEDGVEENCSLLSLRIITSIHDRPPNDALTYVPLKFFNVQQHVSDRVACRNAFIRDAREDFAHCVESRRDRSLQEEPTETTEKQRLCSTSRTRPSPSARSSILSLEMGRGGSTEKHDSRSREELEPHDIEVRGRRIGSLSRTELTRTQMSKADHSGGEGTPCTFVHELCTLFSGK